MNREQLTDNYMAGDVQRFHSTPGITKQTISEHSWGVALIVQYLAPTCSKRLIMAALTHDVAESITGDIPAPVKWADPNVSQLFSIMEKQAEKKLGVDQFLEGLSEQEEIILKLADTLEGMFYCNKRMFVGEKGGTEPFYQWQEFLKRTSDRLDKLPDDMVIRFSELYMEVTGEKVGAENGGE